MPEERLCRVGDVRVRYRVAGAGPPAVLVHGLAGSWRWWEPVVAELVPHLRVHLIDLPGFGSSRGSAFVLADAPAFVRALVRRLGLERPHLVGHSLGGAVCARLAATWPDSVAKLVLVAPAGLLERRRPAHYALPLAAALRSAPPRFLGVVARDAFRAGVPTLYRAATQLLGDETLRDELAAIRAPTLLVWGERDRLVPVRLAEGYAQTIPDVRLAVLPGAGHVPMAERPLEFARTVLHFLDAATARARP